MLDYLTSLLTKRNTFFTTTIQIFKDRINIIDAFYVLQYQMSDKRMNFNSHTIDYQSDSVLEFKHQSTSIV
jgi:hypothetical protein